jgi:tetratricopeptide (TPR) repeat protein
MEPKIADDALERLRSLAEKFETPPDSVQDALVEILLAKGDVLRAGEILRESLRNNPEKSKRVMDLMRPHVENVSDSLALHFLYMDAALLAEQTRRVLEKVKAIRRSEQHRDELYEWLEKKSAEQFLPADVMIVHGEMALEKEKFDRAVEILKAVVASSPNDANAVMTILEKHKNGNRKIAEFYDEQLEKQRSDAPQHADDGSEFEHFENKEFKFTSGAKDEIQIETEEGPGLGDKVDPARDAVKPVELDPGPFGGAGGEEEAGGLEVEDGGGLEAEDGGGLEVEDNGGLEVEDNGGLEVEDNGGLEVEDGGGLEVEDGGDLEVDNGGGFELEGGGDKRKSPLELGLERAAEAVAKDRSAEILWEEEDADGILETGTEPVNADSEEDDSWLELQGDSVMGGGGLTDSGRQDEAEEHADPQPESPPRPEVADWDEPAEPEAPSPAEDSTREDTAEETDEQPQTAEQGPAAEDAAPEEPACDIGEQHVLNLAESLSRAGARLFFYVQTESGSETAERPSQDSPSGEPKPEDVPAEAAAPQPEGQKDEPPGGDDLPAAIAEVDVEVDVPLETPIESAPDSPDSFEAQFERFLDGKLDNDAVLELAASALESGKTEEARELLHFDPENDGQRSARMRYLVEYYVALDKPSAALNLIDSIDLASLAAEDRRVILIKKASCHNIMNDFESAKAVYDEIANEFPSDEVDKLLERNNERLKRRRDGGALVLEITTSLQDD